MTKTKFSRNASENDKNLALCIPSFRGNFFLSKNFKISKVNEVTRNIEETLFVF